MNGVLENIRVKLSARQKSRASPVLKRIEQELVTTKKVFYGGMAQNLYLPKKHRFYKDTDVPDYDVYCHNAKDFVIRLANKLRSFGKLEVRCAKHPGTYKLYWENIGVLDVTEVSLAEFRRLRKQGKRTPEGLLLAPLSLVKANAYLELASPDTAWFRWKKVYARIALLEQFLKTNKNSFFKFPVIKKNKNNSSSLITGFHAARFHMGFPFIPELAPLRFTKPDRCIATDPKNNTFASLFHVLYMGYHDLYSNGHTDIPITKLVQLVSETKLNSECVGTVPVRIRLSRWSFRTGTA